MKQQKSDVQRQTAAAVDVEKEEEQARSSSNYSNCCAVAVFDEFSERDDRSVGW